MSDENVLTIAHQDGEQTLVLTSGGDCIENGRLTIAIDTENRNPDGWPPCAHFCFYDHAMEREVAVGDVFECHGGLLADDDNVEGATKVSAYFSFHAEEVYVKWTVIDIRGDLVVFKFEAKHDDTDYYDERAKECPTVGTFALAKKPFGELWIPE